MQKVISPETFPEITKKLMDMKVDGTSEFAQTILTMGSRDQFAMVEDFGWSDLGSFRRIDNRESFSKI